MNKAISTQHNMNKQEIQVPTSLFNPKEFVCGWGAAFINIFITYPVNKIIFRQMLYDLPPYGAFKQLKGEGLYYLYRGILPPLIQKTCSLSVMFGVYEEVRRPLMLHTNFNPYVSKSVAGLIAGSLEAILMPFERIQTLLVNRSYHKEFKNTIHAFQVVGLQYGIKECYRGIWPILLRNGPSNACFFIMRDEVDLLLPRTDNAFYKSAQTFFSGAFIGVILSSIFYPLNVLKVSMQSQLGGKSRSILYTLRVIYVERGRKVRYIYRGVSLNCTRAFLSWGVMNAAYDGIKRLIY